MNEIKQRFYVNEIINQIKNAKGTNAKIAILKKNSENADLKEFLRLTYDDSINFWIRKIPEYTPMGTIPLEVSLREIMLLANRTYTGHAGIEFLKGLLENSNTHDAESLVMIIKGDTETGIGVTSTNKIWKKLIPVWPCQKATKFSTDLLHKMPKPWIAQEKSDGARTNFLVNDTFYTGFEAWSGNGKFLDFNEYFSGMFKALNKILCIDIKMVYDGEALVTALPEDILLLEQHGKKLTIMPDGEKILPRAKGNGKFTKAIRGSISQAEIERFRFNVWCYMPYTNFIDKKKYTVDYLVIQDKLEMAVSIFKNTYPEWAKFINYIPYEMVDSEEDVMNFYYKQLLLGKEGAVIKSASSHWENKRSKDQLKMKIKDPADLVCVDTYPHEKKPEWIGGLILEDRTGKLRVSCGSGLKDKDREKPANYFIGKIIATNFNEVQKNFENPEKPFTLFIPIFERVRETKSEADTLTLGDKGQWIFPEQLKKKK